MRVRAVTIAVASLLLPGCDGAEEPTPAATASAAGPRPGEANMPEGGLPPFGERAAVQRETGSWMQRLEPQPSEFCSFSERPPSERPEGWVVTAWSGNMDLYTDGYVLGQDPSARWIEAMWMKGRPVIAARAGLDDLWIEPQGDYTNTILRIGPDELTCVRWEG